MSGEFETLLEQIGDGVPDAAQYQRMSGLILDVPEARTLARMDPFSPDYKATAMDLYLSLRGRAEQGYRAARDEAPATPLPASLWTGLVPWSFRDARVAAEHLFAWGHILSHLNVPAGGSVLEYGPGSGQLLLTLSRMGYRACGVDIDASALEGITGQAAHLGLPVETERAEFGAGFAGERFDCILFYEAFHHAFDFDELLLALHGRLRPGGRLVLCGEPVVPAPSQGIPYAWGPRLDALSVFCMRRFGWMELGFTHPYFMRIAEITGWTPTFHPYPNCGRAHLYVLEPGDRPGREALHAEQVAALRRELAAARAELDAAHASTSWRATRPLRASKAVLDRVRQARDKRP